jgi:serine/threonine-protein kinase
MPIALDQVIGPYHIVSQIGRGGMATVYKAYQAALDRFVAIKVPLADFQSNPEFISSFSRETKIIAKLDHPNIIPIYDVSEFEGTPYIVMRFVDGQTLRGFLNKHKKPVRLPTILTIMRAVTSALTDAHQKSVLHRDVKPSNIMLGNDGNVYLMDFGLARIVAEADLTLSRDRVVGTPTYISPEQAKGETLDERTDIYSLGIVLFEMLTGRVPFTGERPSVVVYHHISTPPPQPSKINPEISPRLEQVILKALAKDRKDRFANAAAMMQALQEVVAGEVKPAKPNAAAEPDQPPPAAPGEQLKPAEPSAKPGRQFFSPSGFLLGLSILILLSELVFFFPTLRTELRNALIALGSTSDQDSRSDLMRIILGTLSAYIATLSTHILLSKLRQLLSGAAFFFAIAFGVTLFIALALGFLVLVLLNVL